MMKKLAVIITFLLLIGVSLTVYLPAYDPSNLVSEKKQQYQINKASLKAPVLLSETSLKIQKTEDDFYGLQLGMFSRLDQAVTMAKTDSSADNTIIVKVSDKTRYWYLLIHGPFASKEMINQQKMNNSATLIRWPLKIEKINPQANNKPSSDIGS